MSHISFHVASQYLLWAAATYSGVVWGGWLGALNTAQNCCCHKNLKRAPKCGRSPGYGQPPTEHRWVGAMPEQRQQALRAGFFSAFSSPHFSEVGRVEHNALHRVIHFWNSLSQVAAQIEVDRAMLGGRNSSSQETQ